jgi:hypothetical protein
MRPLVMLALLLALIAPAAYVDDPGDGAEWGVFYTCLPDGCGWWLCWPGEPCYPI